VIVLTAIFTDIHGNREALEACLASARQRDIGRTVFLGDFVGYGADPGFAVDTAMAHVERGAIALLGNHDSAAIGHDESMNDDAARAIAWTRTQLDGRQLGFLQSLPYSEEDGDLLYVHASAASPRLWDYMLDAGAAIRSLKATPARVTICGHVHVPMLFQLSKARGLAAFEPPAATALPLHEGRSIAVIGAVGQPRDGNPDACYALYDDAADALTYVRVPYDIDTAAKKIRAAGLPRRLAARLAFGQ
jgi:diadenosine tetraphosphatase ApaH/serine/threonine PP2A family protein phosphatase